MSLLKALQQELTCTKYPWFPVGSANTRFLINEIVVGEESDVDAAGNRMSHFELYLMAMEQCGAETGSIKRFIEALRAGSSLEDAFDAGDTPNAAREFVRFTFDVIHTHQPHIHAAVFTFGREDLIPNMFLAMVEKLDTTHPETISLFKYYLERHIEVDGDHHSLLALAMTEDLCGEDAVKWQEAQDYAIRSLQQRKALWDGLLQCITA
jgi:hypothetical protein